MEALEESIKRDKKAVKKKCLGASYSYNHIHNSVHYIKALEESIKRDKKAVKKKCLGASYSYNQIHNSVHYPAVHFSAILLLGQNSEGDVITKASMPSFQFYRNGLGLGDLLIILARNQRGWSQEFP